MASPFLYKLKPPTRVDGGFSEMRAAASENRDHLSDFRGVTFGGGSEYNKCFL